MPFSENGAESFKVESTIVGLLELTDVKILVDIKKVTDVSNVQSIESGS